ncbi:MAG: hypothetical protein BroJett040_03000 [Oligoflexia bacterium]|nr:MAG: hypothetical protein BroJett040_03000 [Oligoflexia bacterium]
MAKLDSKTIEHYQNLLAQDPKSKIFAALAEAYREMGMDEQAEALARRGTINHPTYAPGFVVLGRIMLGQKKYDDALFELQKAVQLSPENILAHQLIGQVHLELKNTKEALKAHKMALFLNPQDTRSQKVVSKLESITADEFDTDLFQMGQLKKATLSSQPASEQVSDKKKELDRTLSLADALIIRNEIDKAHEILKASYRENPTHEGITQRLEMLESHAEDGAQQIRPMVSREKRILGSKIKKLQTLLKTIDKNRFLHG